MDNTIQFDPIQLAKLKKEDLITTILDLKHLADSIKAKDGEIAILRDSLRKEESANVFLSADADKNKHLGEAVKAKDIELSQLRPLRVELDKANQELDRLKHLGEAIKAKDTDINRLTEEKANLVKENRELSTKLSESVTKLGEMTNNIKKLGEEYNRIAAIAQAYIANFRSFMKGVQGSLEVAVELESLLSEKINQNAEQGGK